jgi:regulator of protease activity HflC (stomatin/prohibitin superfamily)
LIRWPDPSRVRVLRWLGWLPAALILVWTVSHVRVVPQHSQAVLLRFGRVADVQAGGLLVALPWPVTRIVLLPDAGNTQRLRIAGSADGGFLTNDGGIVVLDATLSWRVVNAATYAVQADTVERGLSALFEQAAVRTAACHRLDDFLPARGAGEAGPGDMQAAILVEMNRQLATLRQSGEGLGVQILRVEATASLPPGATASFDAVVEATRGARDDVAAAAADAARMRGEAAGARDANVAASHALAAEILAGARAQTASILALAHGDLRTRPAMLDQVYRERVGQILAQAKNVNIVDAKSVSHLILPGSP